MEEVCSTFGLSRKPLDGKTCFCMAKAQMSATDAARGENSVNLRRFCYPRVGLYLAENFIWIGSTAL